MFSKPRTAYLFSSLLALSILLSPLGYSNLTVEAQQQAQLIVSASEDPEQNNTFFGPQVIEIVIDDPGARDPDTSTGGLVVKGEQTERVHLADGRWYSYIADEDTFLLFLDLLTDGNRDNRIAVSNLDDADNRNTEGSITIVFGQQDSFVREITEVGNSLFVEVNKNSFFPTIPEPFSGPDVINPDLDINPSMESEVDWPYIKLVEIQETENVEIRQGNTSVRLAYTRFYDNIQLTLDRSSYPINSDIIAVFKDFMWNINPTTEDVLRFVLSKDTGRPEKIFYQPVRNFDPGSNGPNLADIISTLQVLEFDSRQIMEIEGVNNLKFKEVFNSSTGMVVEFPETTGRLLSEMATNEIPVVKFIEEDPNTSSFSTVDEVTGGRSSIFAGRSDATASFDYFDIIASAPMGTRDASIVSDAEIYNSADRAIFTLTDLDLNQRSNIAERHSGIESKSFVTIGKPFPISNNDSFNTIPKDGSSNFQPSSFQLVRFSSGTGGTAEGVDSNQDGTVDFSASPDSITSRTLDKTDFIALDFSAVSVDSGMPNGFIVNSNVKLSDIASSTTFTVTKDELLDSADPFILAVSRLKPEISSTFTSAAGSERITVTFPRYNLMYVNLLNLNSVFAKAFVELEASNGVQTVSQMVDFEPFDEEDLDGDGIVDPDALLGTSGFGSFRIIDFQNVDWNGDGRVGDSSDIALLSNIPLKITVIITDSANTPLPINAGDHQAVLDIAGIAVIRTTQQTVDDISLDASANLIYRLEIKEQGENSSNFVGRTDFMTVLHDDTVQNVIREIQVVGDPVKIWMPNRSIPPNRIPVSYTDLDIAGELRQVTVTVIYETKDAHVSWDREQYRFSQVAVLTVNDEDLNRRPDAVEQYSVPQDGFLFFEFDKQRADTECNQQSPVPNECFARFVESTLRETSPNSGEFRAQITMPQRVLLENGDVIRTFKSDIRAVYVDARDSSSNVNQFHGTSIIRSDIDTSQPQPEPVTENPAVVERGSIKIELDKASYHPHARVQISITAKNSNLDVFKTDVIFIDVGRESDNTPLEYKLVETGANTGIFTGYVDLRGPDGRDGGVGPKDGRLRIEVGNSLGISFETASISVPINYSEARIFWDKNRYVVGEKAKLTVIEPDMNKNADLPEILKVTVRHKINSKVYELRETQSNSGIFATEIPFVGSTAEVLDKEILVITGDTLTAIYEDNTVPNEVDPMSLSASIQIGNVLELTGVDRVSQERFRLSDEDGDMVTSPKFRSSYMVESTVTNKTNEPLSFSFILQVTDEDGIVRLLEGVIHSVEPDESVTPSLEWKPSKRGNFTVEIFVWSDLDTPSPLSEVMKSKIIVV